MNSAIETWIDHSGCVEPTENYSLAILEHYAPSLLEQKGFCRKGQGKKSLKDLWKSRRDPFAIAYSIGAALEKNITEMRYVFGCLKNAPDCDIISPSSNEGPPGECVKDDVPVCVDGTQEEEKSNKESEGEWNDKEEFLSSLFSKDENANPDCKECHGYGYEVGIVGPIDDPLAIIPGPCQNCFPASGFEYIDENCRLYSEFRETKKKKKTKEIKDGFVYFVQNESNKVIKIGWSQMPEQRIQSLQTSCESKLRIIAKTPGTMEDEKRIHKQFDFCRISGEWFVPSNELISFIEAINNEG